MKKKRVILLIAFIIVILPVAFYLGKMGIDKMNGESEKAAPVFTEVSVHDPSVIKDGDTFYIFGSHLAAAKTDDLMNWERISDGVSEMNPLFENVKEELSKTFEWSQSNTLWAADVIKLQDGKYYMYYNACKGDSPLSALGVAVSDNIEGPYTDLGIILKSGMTGTSEDGTIYDARVHPNVVDPDTFFDKDGNLWMVYGSYSGGIYILQMDPETGKPLPDQGYGKKLLGGNHSRIEGPYIQYIPETGYYYLFLSFGGLDSVGGYNIRVARSENPDGPYVDSEGNEMIDVMADPTLPLFDDASIEPYGVKLMGNYVFNNPDSDGSSYGYVSPGHNSAYYDEESGQMFLIFHTRFPDTGETHEVRVHQMFMNEEGWPVVAPYRYAGEELEEVSKSDVTGEYMYINHGKDISAEIKESQSITLENNGKITGEVSGEWELTGNNSVKLTIDDSVYDGVFIEQWNPATQQYVMTFTALSEEGIAVWGSRTE